METILPELKAFLIEFCEKQKIKNKDLQHLRIDANIEVDLNIFDIDADLLITDFVKKFNIDYSEFNWNKYGYPTSSTFIGIMSLILGRNSYFVNKVRVKLKHSNLKVKHLQEALLTGKLV